MIFKGENRQVLELRILKRQFPDIPYNPTDETSDGNWLDIYIDVKSKMGHWQTVDPSLLTSEVEAIIQWLRELAAKKVNGNSIIQKLKELNKDNILPEYPSCFIVEPNLGFSLVNTNPKTIRISFGAESRPLSADDFTSYYIDCPLSDKELNQAANDLEEELNSATSEIDSMQNILLFEKTPTNNENTTLYNLYSKLSKKLILFEQGLTENEIAQAENAYQIKFPPDLKKFLMYRIPVGKDFPNWRDLNNDYIKKGLAAPLGGILFDVEHNNFWLDSLGEKPNDLKDAFKLMSQAFEQAPKLIPISGHRMIPSDPNEEGNPVLSVMQTDIIYYGANLLDYFENEFLGKKWMTSGIVPKKIKFWLEIMQTDPSK